MGGEALTLGSGRMDTMGDAEQYEYDDEPLRPREPVLTSEALAVTSLAAAISSFFVTTMSQYLVFVFAGALGLGQNDQKKQVALLMAPTAFLSFAAVAAGVLALKRRPEDRWAGALAVAGVAIGAVVLLLAAAALVAMLITDPPLTSD